MDGVSRCRPGRGDQGQEDKGTPGVEAEREKPARRAPGCPEEKRFKKEMSSLPRRFGVAQNRDVNLNLQHAAPGDLGRSRFSGVNGAEAGLER